MDGETNGTMNERTDMMDGLVDIHYFLKISSPFDFWLGGGENWTERILNPLKK